MKNEETQESNCICVDSFGADECQVNLCDNNDCHNDGTFSNEHFTCLVNPCQNNGTCSTTFQADNQACFRKNIEKFAIL